MKRETTKRKEDREGEIFIESGKELKFDRDVGESGTETKRNLVDRYMENK